MNELFRVRVDPDLLSQANKVCAEIGTTSGEVVRMMLSQLVKRRAIPFPLQAESPEDELLGPIERRAEIIEQL